MRCDLHGSRFLTLIVASLRLIQYRSAVERRKLDAVPVEAVCLSDRPCRNPGAMTTNMPRMKGKIMDSGCVLEKSKRIANSLTNQSLLNDVPWSLGLAIDEEPLTMWLDATSPVRFRAKFQACVVCPVIRFASP